MAIQLAAVEKQDTFAPQAELGASGLKQWSGRIEQDFLRDLNSSDKRYKLYREIRDNSPVVGGAFAAIGNLLRRTAIITNAGGTDEADERAAELVRTSLEDMSHGFGTHITQSLSALAHGWAPFEVVYKKRNGPQRGNTASSRYTDGLIGWRKMAMRSQESLDRWDFDDEGGVQGFWQRPAPKYNLIHLPIDKLLLMRNEDELGNPEGRSILRNCVPTWKFVKRIQEVEAIGVERDLAGYPVVWVPPELLNASAGSAVTTALANYKKLAVNIRRDEQEGAVMPLEYDSNGHKRYDLTLLTTGGTRQFDTGAIVQRYEQRMLIVMLADFLLLGHERVGSFSLSSDKTDLFALSIAAYLESILDVWNRFAIPRLLALNGMTGVDPPFLTHGDIETQNLADTADYLSKLSAAGFVLPDADGTLGTHLLGLANLPVPDDMAGEDAEVGKRAALVAKALEEAGHAG